MKKSIFIAGMVFTAPVFSAAAAAAAVTTAPITQQSSLYLGVSASQIFELTSPYFQDLQGQDAYISISVFKQDAVESPYLYAAQMKLVLASTDEVIYDFETFFTSNISDKETISLRTGGSFNTEALGFMPLDNSDSFVVEFKYSYTNADMRDALNLDKMLFKK